MSLARGEERGVSRKSNQAGTQSDLSGAQKASVLLMTLGASASADVFKHLTESEIELVALEIERMHDVDANLRREVIAEFELERAAMVPDDGRGGKGVYDSEVWVD